MKKQLKPWLYLAVVLLMSVSCKKEVPAEFVFVPRPELDCDDGTCCGVLVGTRYQFITEFRDEPVSFGRGSFVEVSFKNSIAGKPRAAIVCDLSLGMVKDWESTAAETHQYKYRISGKLYDDKSIRPFCIDCGLPFMVRIEKWEFIK